MTGIILLVIIAVVAVVLISMYNGLVQLRVRADSAWSDIDVQLKRRHDLIPNLVETVKGYATHEKGTFENIAKFRSQAMQATSPADKAVAENQLSGALRGLLAVAEAYPQLKASEEFTQLQSALSMTEDSLQNARRYYNAVVRDFNTKIQSFPTNLLAGMFGQHHPDKLVARGLPKSMIGIAEQKTDEIRAAYEKIKTRRGFVRPGKTR